MRKGKGFCRNGKALGAVGWLHLRVYHSGMYICVDIPMVSVATLAEMNDDEPDEASPEVGQEANENFPIREPHENFCTILPG